MRTMSIGLLAVLLLLHTYAFSQAPKEDTAYVNRLLQESKEQLNEDPEAGRNKAVQAKEVAERIDFPIGQAYALKNIGLAYVIQGKYVEALDYYEQSLRIFREQGDKIGIANLLNNIGSIYADKGDDAKALEYCLQSLKIAEQTGDKLRIMSALINVGSIYHNKKDPKAIDYLLQALPLSEELGNKQASGIIAGNIGEIYADNGDDGKALAYYQKTLQIDPEALSAAYAHNGIGKLYLKKGNYAQAQQQHVRALTISEKLDDKLFRMRTLKGIANTYTAQNNYQTAIGYYLQAKTLGEELKANVELKDLYQDMSVAYTKLGDYPQALLYKTSYADIKDTLYNDETRQKIGRLQFDFDLYKKEGEIKLLTQQKALQEIEVKRERQAKMAFAGGLGLLGVIAFIIYRNYRTKVRINKVLDRQKVEIETLILNILPSEVAKELQATGNATPRSYEKVSVLFSDFKGFSAMAEKMSAEELVEELGTCFKAFDKITEKYRLEKIKTIGDSYMCAGGIPVPDLDHPFRIIAAGLEIRDFMRTHNEARAEGGLEPLDIRIGIHVGPVVAGVVGTKKYAYDIWGSTVNIASRMESNGAPGEVNISAATYELVKEKYVCLHRGKIYAKNVGDIDMYFVQSEITVPSERPALVKPLESLDDAVPAE
jgi:class 3 adenylate cyclase